VVVPSDHFITNDSAYLEDLRDGIEFVRKNGGLLTFGITPTRIETQYGYIQMRAAESGKKITAVKTFTEKPDYELAQKFYESGEFLWNAGIFIWQVGDIIHEIRKHLYDLYSLFENDTFLNTPEEEEFINTIYGQCPNVSIDFGILEKSNQVYVLQGNFGWSDVGTWHAFQALCKQDENNNTSNTSQVIFHNTRNCIVNIPEKKIAVIYGVEDLIIAATDDYLMICHSKDEDEIRHFEKQLKFKK
nr:mannose-1-phosphate guanylyltransferase [Odoribacter sp.]